MGKGWSDGRYFDVGGQDEAMAGIKWYQEQSSVVGERGSGRIIIAVSCWSNNGGFPVNNATSLVILPE